MKCFIHINDEAVAVCKQCGKAMCGNCSAYTNHSGICPECKRNEYIKERSSLLEELSRIKGSLIKCIVFAVLFAILAIAIAVTVNIFGLVFFIGTLIFTIKAISNLIKRKPIADRVDYLSEEIDKLSVALRRSRAII